MRQSRVVYAKSWQVQHGKFGKLMPLFATMADKHDKPNDPAYPGGEDEHCQRQKPDVEKAQRSNNFSLDQRDAVPATAPDDTGADV